MSTLFLYKLFMPIYFIILPYQKKERSQYRINKRPVTAYHNNDSATTQLGVLTYKSHLLALLQVCIGRLSYKGYQISL
jgi:hypothetical protein